MAEEEVTREGITLSTFLQSLISNRDVISINNVNIQDNDVMDGWFAINNFHIQISRKRHENGVFSHYELIVADNSDRDGKKRMAVLTAESLESELVEMDCSGMRENEIIDLNREGRRWEGGELNGKPFGFSHEYSENDNLVYEGFVFEGMKVCVGKEWNDDGNNNCLMYEGGYCNGERCGNGKSWDLSGNVDFEGEWVNNHVMTNKEKIAVNNLIVPMSIEKLVIGNKRFNDENITSLYFTPPFIRLKRIDIGNECYEYVREFVIDGLESLESVKIGKFCFRINDKERDDGVCRITNCPNLRQLEIYDDSFEDFKSFELSNLDSLQSIKIGNSCFKYAENLSLKGK